MLRLAVLLLALVLGASAAAGQPKSASQAQPAGPEQALREGNALLLEGTPQSLNAALSDFNRAFAAWQAAGDEPHAVDALLGIAKAQFFLQNRSACAATLERARTLAADARDTLGQANVAYGYALFDDAQSDEPNAIGEATHSAELYRSLSRPAEESQVLFWLAGVYQKSGDQESARRAYARALPASAAAKNPQLQALVELRLAQLYMVQQKDDAENRALALFQRALVYFRSGNDAFDEAMTWWGMGTAYDFLHRTEDARRAYERAAALPVQWKDESAHGMILASLGHDEVLTQAWTDAARNLQNALTLLNAPADLPKHLVPLIDLGSAREALRDAPGALQAYQTAADESHRSGDAAFEATAWLKAAAVYDASFDWAGVIDASGRAVAAAKSNTAGETMLPAALLMLSTGYLNEGDQRRALQTGLEALPLLQGNDRLNDLISIGIAYSWLGEYAKALDVLEPAVAQSNPNSAERAGILAVLAEVNTSLADAPHLQEAERQAQEARQLYHALRLPSGEAKALNQLGLVYQETGQRARSEAVLDAALNEERAAGNAFLECATLNNLGDLQRFFGDFRQAEPLYRQALELTLRLGNQYQQAAILDNLALAENGLGRVDEALDTLHRALKLHHTLSDPDSEAKSLSAIGLIEVDSGHPQDGLEALLQALPLNAPDDVASKATLLNNVSHAYRSLGAYDVAETYLREAEALGLQTYADSRATIEGNLATLELARALAPGRSVDFKQSHLQKASELYGNAVAALQGTGDKIGETVVLVSQAVIASEQGRQQDALSILGRAHALASQTADLDTQALVEHTIGTVYLKLDDPAKALEHLQGAKPLWSKIEDAEGEEQTLFVMAKAERQQDRLEAALRDVDGAIELSSDIRTRVTADERRASLFASGSAYFQLEIALLMEMARRHPDQGYEARAFDAAEAGRARSLLDLLAEAHADIRQGADPALLSQEREFRLSLDAKEAAKQKLLKGAPESERTAIENDITNLSSKYDVVEAKLRAASPDYAALTHPQPLTVEAIQHEMLDASTVLLEYAVGDDGSYLWAITQSGLSVYRLPPRRKIEEVPIGDLPGYIKNRDDSRVAGLATQLSEMLLKPVARDLRQRIIIVADGELQNVPFAILPEPDSGAPLLLHHEILIEPSASVAAALHRRVANRTEPPKLVAVIADPVFGRNDERLQPLAHVASERDVQAVMPTFSRLPNTAAEARSILALSEPSRALALVGFDANKNAVLNVRLADYHVLHFATHGFVDSDEPALSGLALSMYDRRANPIDGLLTLNDIYNLQSPVDLVVLSACESGTGAVIAGEGTMALTRGFMFGGARSVIASLWKVDDPSTAELMRRFYQAYFSNAAGRPAAALRAAQLAMLRDKRWADSYDWAAFSVQGDWR